MEKWQWFVENWFNIFTIGIALLSARYAFKANNLSKIANDNSKVANELSERANKIAEETVYNGYFWILNEISSSLKDIKRFIDNNDINKEENFKEMQYKFYCFTKSYTEIYNKGFKIPRDKMAFYQDLINDIENLKDKFNHYEFEEALEELEQVISVLKKRL